MSSDLTTLIKSNEENQRVIVSTRHVLSNHADTLRALAPILKTNPDSISVLNDGSLFAGNIPVEADIIIHIGKSIGDLREALDKQRGIDSRLRQAGLSDLIR